MSQPPVGIDLGTTYSALAVINPAGRPEIVPNADGERITPSAVFFQEDGSVIVGGEAVAAAGAYPNRVVRWSKRHVGDPDWSVCIDGKTHDATSIAALVLARLRKDAEQSLGPIDKAVVTVPAYFDEARRKATMDAVEMAGLEPMRIINEPTAAAIAHASTGRVSGTCLVYDLGGGTFDVSIVKVNPPHEVEVVTSEGDHQLGGVNFDLALAGLFNHTFMTEKGVALNEDAACMHQVLQTAESVKRSLSRRTEVSGIALQWKGHALAVSVDRARFDQVIEDLLLRTEMLMDNALMDAGLGPEGIDHVLLVGGSTRMPAVTELLRKKFGKEPMTGISVDESVALGAAIQAGVIAQERGELALPELAASTMAATRIRDVTNHSYGTLAISEAHGAVMLRNSIIIPKNTPIPHSTTKVFYTGSDGQDCLELVITQGEDEDPEFVKKVVEAEMQLPPNRPAGCPIEVAYSYDANQRMRCVFKDVQSGRTMPFDLDQAGEGKKKNKAFGELAATGARLDDLLAD